MSQAASAPKIFWQSAFVAYCNGAPQEEISQIFDIPLPTLMQRMRAENWPALREKLPLAVSVVPGQGGAPMLPAKINAKLELIQQNRDQNLRVFAELRDHVVDMVKSLKAGTLKVKKVVKGLGLVDVDPSPQDWLAIASYAKVVSEGSYRALGDFAAQEKAGSDAPAGTLAPAGPAITIILPGAIAAPRQERRIDAEVIDLTTVTTETSAE